MLHELAAVALTVTVIFVGTVTFDVIVKVEKFGLLVVTLDGATQLYVDAPLAVIVAVFIEPFKPCAQRLFEPAIDNTGNAIAEAVVTAMFVQLTLFVYNYRVISACCNTHI